MISPLSAARLPEIRPTSVVLPAPFGPMSACTSPGAMSKLTWSVATTPPKRRVTSLRRSTGLPPEEAGDALRREEHDGEHHQADAEVRVLLVVWREARQPADRVVGDEVLEAEQHRRAEHAAPQAADAAEDHHDHQRARLHPVQHVRVDVLAVAREQRAGQSRGGAGGDAAHPTGTE